MLDVHPPHHPTHTWRDFFIHIATIVVGLLIAVCLEQGVEAIHRHHERQQLIEDLRQEAEGRNHVIRNNLATTQELVQDVKSHMSYRVQISTDGMNSYAQAIEESFGADADDAEIVKIYGNDLDANRRYSPFGVICLDRVILSGKSNVDQYRPAMSSA